MLDWLNPFKWWHLFQQQRQWKNTNRQFIHSYHQGDFITATELAVSMVDIAHKSSNKTRLLDGYYYLMLCHQQTQSIEQAIDCGRRVLELQIALAGTDDVRIPARMLELAGLYRQVGEFESATQLYHQALTHQRRIDGGKVSVKAVGILESLLAIYVAQQDGNRAEKMLRDVRKYREELGLGSDRKFDELAAAVGHLIPEYRVEGMTDLEQWSKLNSQVFELDQKGKSRDAISIGEKALTIARDIFPVINNDLATSLNNLAGLYKSQGRWEEAETLFLEAVNIFRTLFGQKLNDNFPTSLNNLASLYESQGRWRDAEPLFLEALNIRRILFGQKLNDDLATSLNNLASLYESQGRWEEAEPLYLEAVNIFRTLFGQEPNNDLATGLNNLAGLYISQGRRKEAESLLLESLKIRRTLFGQEPNNDLAASLSNLAMLCIHQGRRNEAESLLLEALNICRTLLGQEPNSDLATSLNNLAELYRSQGRWKEAEPLYLEALKIRRTLFEQEPNNDLAASLSSLAMLYVVTLRYSAALPLFSEGIAVENQFLTNYLSYATPENQLILLEQMHDSLEIFTSFIWQYQSDNPEAVAALLTAILQRKAASTITSAILNRTQYTNRYPELAETFDLWNDLKQQITQTDDESTRKRLESESKQLQEYLARRVPEIKAESLDITHQTVAFYLPPLSQLIEFFRFRAINFQTTSEGSESRYLALILSPDVDTAVQLIDLGTAAPIDELIEKYRRVFVKEDRQQMSKPKIKQTPKPIPVADNQPEIDAGCELRARIIDPILRQLSPDTDTLILAADSQLYRVPFATLPLDSSGSRLLDKYRIETLTAGRDFLRRQAGESAATSTHRPPAAPLLVGNPDYDLDVPTISPTLTPGEKVQQLMGEDFDRMPQTEELINSIAARLPNPRCLVDRQAISTAFQPQTSPQILVVATHGFAFANEYHREQQAAWNELYQFPRAEDAEVIAKYGKFIDADFRAQLQQWLRRDPKGDNADWYRALLPEIDNHIAQLPAPTTRELSRETNPMRRCGIALTGATQWLLNQPLPAEMGTGVLLAHDIAQLNLWGTDLVVLIACSTGLGDSTNGQGMFGLRRALAIAGAKHAIVSLWNVPIQPSILLMDYFFGLYLDGVAPAAALHQAQQYLRNISIGELRAVKVGENNVGEELYQGLLSIDEIKLDTDPSFQPLKSPFYWGAWICQG